MINTDLTTPLTIYGFGLCGHGVTERTKKVFVPTRKHQKTRKSLDFTSISAFGTKRSHVQIVSLRPKSCEVNLRAIFYLKNWSYCKTVQLVIYSPLQTKTW